MNRCKRNINAIVSLAAVVIIAVSFPAILCSPEEAASQTAVDLKRKGIWVTCFSAKKVFYSKPAAKSLVKFCKNSGINEIYLQLYRGGYAYFDSRTADRSKYEDMAASFGQDPIKYIIQEAADNDISVHAWVNVLSISQNMNADLIKKFGKDVLTQDQHGRYSIRTDRVKEFDKHYLRDDQIFLEPGDPRVREYLVTVFSEIVSKYPGLAGIQLDYIRYPTFVPYLPDSRFMQFGLVYGYGRKSVESFESQKGFSPFKIDKVKDGPLLWDNWKREQVTKLVGMISKAVKAKSPNMKVSACTLPSPDRSYSFIFQDWALWLEKGIVDDVFLMCYTKDKRLLIEQVRASLANRGKGRVYVGLGLFVLKDYPGSLKEQYESIVSLDPDGIAFFAYDDSSLLEEIF